MRRFLPGILFTLCLASCATTRPPGWFEETRVIHLGEPFRVPDAIDIELGFDAPGKRTGFRDGNNLLYGLRLEKPGKEQTWFLTIAIDQARMQIEGLDLEHKVTMTQTIRRKDGDPIQVKSTVMVVKICIYDAAGELLSETHANVPRESLALGFCEAARRFSGRVPPAGFELSDSDEELSLKTLATSVSLMAIIEKNEVLAPLLWEVVAAPSLTSLIFNLGAAISIDTQLTKAEPWTGSLPFASDVQAYRMPVEILANDQPALLASAIVVQPTEPMNIGAGIFSIVGIHPNDPKARVRLELLAARIGDGPVLRPFRGIERRRRKHRARSLDRRP